jgi:hypothetical protein
MESTCAIKTGFFVLRTCPNLPQFTCENCNRSICQRHIRDEANHPLCLECFAKLHPEEAKAETEDTDWDDTGDDFLSDAWYFSIRESYYSRNTKFSAFSDDDYEGFNRSGHSEFMDDRDTGSLFDS